MIIEFPEFLPDLPALENPGITLAKNVIPYGGSYKSFPVFTSYSNALDAYCRGGFSARDPETAVTYNFAGTQTKLYALGIVTTAIFTDVSKLGGYTLGADEQWDFTQFGDFCIATNINSAMQTFEMGVSTQFSDLSATAPQARYITVVRDDFLVAANTFDAVDGFKPYRIRWAALGSSTDWTVSPTTQADFQDMDAGYGWIQACLGGNYGVIIQEKAISRMDYIGSPVVFQFRTIEKNQGTKYPRSAIRVGDLTFFIGLDGFRVFDGNQSIQIGVNKVDRFFADDLDTNYDFLICSAVDYKNNIVMWAYPSRAVGHGAINSRLLIYNYSPNAKRRWAYVDMDVEFMYTALSSGYTLDGLDQWQIDHGMSANIDILPYPLDSRVWVGNNIEAGIFGSDHKLELASADALTAVLETAEVQVTSGQRTDIFLIKPVVDGTSASITMQIGYRNLLNEAVTWGSSLPVDADGHCQARSNARYHRLRTTIASNFTHAIGVELLEYKAGGIR